MCLSQECKVGSAIEKSLYFTISTDQNQKQKLRSSPHVQKKQLKNSTSLHDLKRKPEQHTHTHSKIGIERNSPNLRKLMLTSFLMLNAECFSPPASMAKLYILSTLIQHFTGSSSQSRRHRKKKKQHIHLKGRPNFLYSPVTCIRPRRIYF